MHDDEFDEVQGGHNTRTYTWDVADLDAPVLAGFRDAAGQSIDHNQYIKGEFTYQANYRRGLRILEMVDPATGGMSEFAELAAQLRGARAGRVPLAANGPEP